MTKGVVNMTYELRIEKNIYNWTSLHKSSFEDEYNIYFLNNLKLQCQFQNLFMKVKNSYKFAESLFENLDYDSSDEYEETAFKLNNCKFYIENTFKSKADELLKGIYYSDSTYERIIEILNSYVNIIERNSSSPMKNRLDQIGRIATSVRGLLDDVQFTLELNNLFDTKKSSKQALLFNVTYEYINIRKEQPKLTLNTKDKVLICV